MFRINFNKSVLTLALLAVLAACSEKAPDPAKLLTDGRAALEKNDLKTAIIHLKNLASLEPNNGEARLLLARAYRSQNDIISAKKEYERAFDLGYRRDEIANSLAETMLEAGERKQLIDRFNGYRINDPGKQAELQAHVARARLADGDVQKAKADFDAVLAVSPDLVIAKIGRARVLAAEGKNDEALVVADELLAKNPNEFFALTLKADVYLTTGNVMGSLANLEKAVAAKPEDYTARVNLVALYNKLGKTTEADAELAKIKAKSGMTHAVAFLEAQQLYRKGNLPAAQEAIRLALKFAPDAPPYVILASLIESGLGNAEAADKHLNTIIGKVKDKDYARMLQAQAALKANKGAQALDQLKPVLEAGSKNPLLYQMAGEAAAMNNDMARAKDYYEKAASLGSKSTELSTKLAVIKLNGNNSDGINDLESISRNDGNNQYADTMLALTHLSKRQWDQALAAIAQMEKKQAENPIIPNLKAAAYMGKQDPVNARAALEKGMAKQPESVAILQNIARMDIAEKKFDVAASRFDALLKKDPNHFHALLALAEVRAASGASEKEVTDLFERAAKANSKAVEVPLANAAYYIKNHNTAKAITVLKDAAQKMPDDGAIAERLGLLFMQSQAYADASAQFGRLAKMQPNNVNNLLRLADSYVGNKNEAGAMQTLNRILEIKPDSLDAKVMFAKLAQRSGNTKEAENIAKDLQKTMPKSNVGFMLAGELNSLSKNSDQALAEYKKGYEVTGDAVFVGRIHSVYLASKKDAEADAFAKEQLSKHKNHPSIQLAFAENTMAAGKNDQAIAYYQAVLGTTPNNVIALNNLAWLQAQAKDPKAVAAAEKAMTLLPKDARILDTAGVVYTMAGQHDKAIKVLQDATLLQSGNAEYKLHLAQAYVAAGQKDKAKQALAGAENMSSTPKVNDEIRVLLRNL
ncbi:MAG: hypothetical protein RLZZ502_938 [Pseudomonadota bacterium]